MKLTVIAGQFKEALAVATKAMGSTHRVAITAGVLVEATTDGGLKLTGTDVNTHAWRVVSARVETAGAVVLPQKPLDNFLNACAPADEVTLTVKGKRADLVCGRAEVRLAGLGDPEEFPACPVFDDPSFDLTIAARLLVDLIGSVGHAMATDESRPVLAGIHLEIRDGRLTTSAADGLRLATRRVELDDAPEISLVASGSSILEAAGLLKTATSARLLVNQEGSRLLVDAETGCISVPLIDGQFPDWRRIVPAESSIAVVLQRAPLMRAMNLVRTITTTVVSDKGKAAHAVKARLSISADSIEIKAGDEQGDQEAEITLDAVLEHGEPLVIGANSQHLYQALNALDGDTVLLEMQGPNAPILVHPEGDRNHLHVLQSMSLKL